MKKQVISPEGLVFKSVNAMTAYYGIGRETYIYRINKGWTVEEALGIVERRKDSEKEFIDPNGNRFQSMKEVLVHYHVKPEQYYGRLRIGWTVEEALGIVPRERVHNWKARHIKTICPNGLEFESIKDMCLHYNINPMTYHNRRSLNWTVEEALELKKRNIKRGRKKNKSQ